MGLNGACGMQAWSCPPSHVGTHPFDNRAGLQLSGGHSRYLVNSPGVPLICHDMVRYVGNLLIALQAFLQAWEQHIGSTGGLSCAAYEESC